MKIKATFGARALTVMLLATSIPIGLVNSTDSQICQAEEINTQAVEKALPETTWYDADEGALRPIVVNRQVDDSMNRDSRWLPKPKRVQKSSTNTSTGTNAAPNSPTGFFGSGLTLGNLLGWLLLLIIVIATAAAIAYTLSRSEFNMEKSIGEKQDLLSRSPDEQMIERMKHLPAELRRTDVNLRREAERLMGNGEYDQAIILLFGHQLLLLDRVSMLRLNRGKTNRKYLREVQRVDSNVARFLAATIAAFESSYFGDHEIEKARFDRLWQFNLALEKATERRSEVAA